MVVPELPSLDEALAQADGSAKRHVLLGNGFSIGAHAKFSYGTLYEQAKQATLPDHVMELFDCFGTTNFEQVMRQLDNAQRLADHYRLVPTDDDRDMRSDYEALKDALVSAIADTHPAVPGEVGENKLSSCSAFLDRFHTIFTTNYDLLLYWASVSQFQDGFGREQDTPEEYVVFRQESVRGKFIYFLHGALHLTTAGGEVRKFVWSTTGIPLMQQVEAALDQRHYPLVVSEGSHTDKAIRIEASSYLSWAFRRFENIQGTLFTYGSALSHQDRHLLEAIARNQRLKSLVVGVYGDPSSEPNSGLMATAQRLRTRRKEHHPGSRSDRRRGPHELDVRFYDAGSVAVWGA